MGKLSGLVASTVTPFSEDGSLDEGSFARLCEALLAAGAEGLFVSGTNGEGLLLEEAERVALVRIAVRVGRGRVPIVGHAGQLATARAGALARAMVQAGADAVAALVPIFYRADEVALRAHFATIADAAAAPTYLYNFSALTGVELAPEVVGALRAHPRIAGLKYTGKDLDRLGAYVATGTDVFLGGDALCGEALRRGAVGVVSGLAGCLPEPFVRLFQDWRTGREGPAAENERAGAAEREVARAAEAFAGLAAVPALKWALVRRGWIRTAQVRGPLRPLGPAEQSALAARLDALGGL